MSDINSNIRNPINLLVINLATRSDRRSAMQHRLEKIILEPKFVKAIEPKDLHTNQETYLRKTAECVWLSHKECLRLASESSCPTLILEDDAILQLDNAKLLYLIKQIEDNKIDFLQIGFLHLNSAESISILIRNIYNLVLKFQLAPKIFEHFGFKEVTRSEKQHWRKNMPWNFVVNDIRYGAHCYLVTPEFATKMLALNSPAFLSADDFYVALGKMKTFKMVRLSRSRSGQDESPSSFNARYVLE